MAQCDLPAAAVCRVGPPALLKEDAKRTAQGPVIQLAATASAEFPPAAPPPLVLSHTVEAEPLAEVALTEAKAAPPSPPPAATPVAAAAGAATAAKGPLTAKGSAASRPVPGRPRQLQKYRRRELQGVCGPCGALLGSTTPTNYMILTQRTYNRSRGFPNHNADDITPLFRDYLMPLRKHIYRIPGALLCYKVVVEEIVGCKGYLNYVDARTKWMDGVVQQALLGGLTQVVVIAAGYDTRPYRLHRSGVKFFEVDLPQVSEQKQRLVDAVLPDRQQYPRPAYVGADLAVLPLGEALEPHGFDPRQPAIFTCEGIFTYLPQAVVDSLLQHISALAAPGSRICFDGVHRDVLEGRRTVRGFAFGAKMLAARGEPLLSGFEFADMPAFMRDWAKLGWRVSECWDPKGFCAKELPHLKWKDRAPPMLAFMNHTMLVKQ